MKPIARNPVIGRARKEQTMAKYVVLVNWTEKGVAEAKSTTDRADKVRKLVEDLGGKEDLLLWTLGRYDIVGVFDFKENERRRWLVSRSARWAPCGRKRCAPLQPVKSAGSWASSSFEFR